jgi:hypothetical protein
MRNVYSILVGKHEGKRPFLRPGPGCWRKSLQHTLDNVRMNLREMGWESVGWMQLGQGRDQWQALVNMVMNLWVS